jgi:ATP-dependent DNA helicase UvrD/PcrA
MIMFEELKNELAEVTAKIVNSTRRKKVVVAGPGAGKTYLFKRLLQQSNSANTDAKHLVVSFINALVNDLAKDLSDLAEIFTFHGYCHCLLHRNAYLREGLSKNFTVFPRLPTIIKADWSILNVGVDPPEFVKRMRQAIQDNSTRFYLEHSNFYDAVGFDDMVYRVYFQLLERPEAAERFSLILVDEYQDFNVTEVGLLEVLARKSPIVIAGDDDQVLYGAWRESSSDFIRRLYNSADFETCSLPFCMRCPEVVIQAFGDVVGKAVRAAFSKDEYRRSFAIILRLRKRIASLIPRSSTFTRRYKRRQTA